MPKFTRKPIIYEAFQLPKEFDDPSDELIDFISDIPDFENDGMGGVIIHSWSGDICVAPEEWIVRISGNEYKKYTTEEFNKFYREVS